METPIPPTFFCSWRFTEAFACEKKFRMMNYE